MPQGSDCRFQFPPGSTPRSKDAIIGNLELCCAYWDKTIAPHLARPLAHLEWAIAEDAHFWMVAAQSEAWAFNQTASLDQRIEPVESRFTLPVWAKRSLHGATAIDLALIASHLSKDAGKLSAKDAVAKAHELLDTVQEYISWSIGEGWDPKTRESLEATRALGIRFGDILAGPNQPAGIPALSPNACTMAALRLLIQRSTWMPAIDRQRRLQAKVLALGEFLELRKRRFSSYRLKQARGARKRHGLKAKAKSAAATPTTSGHGWAPPGA